MAKQILGRENNLTKKSDVVTAWRPGDTGWCARRASSRRSPAAAPGRDRAPVSSAGVSTDANSSRAVSTDRRLGSFRGDHVVERADEMWWCSPMSARLDDDENDDAALWTPSAGNSPRRSSPNPALYAMIRQSRDVLAR